MRENYGASSAQLGSQHSVVQRPAHQLGPRRNAEPSLDAGAVGLDRTGAEHETARDLAAGVPQRDQTHHPHAQAPLGNRPHASARSRARPIERPARDAVPAPLREAARWPCQAMPGATTEANRNPLSGTAQSPTQARLGAGIEAAPRPRRATGRIRSAPRLRSRRAAPTAHRARPLQHRCSHAYDPTSAGLRGHPGTFAAALRRTT